MRVEHVRSGEPGTISVGGRWILVFGGVSRVGDRRARRAVSNALASGADVVWFDGFEAESGYDELTSEPGGEDRDATLTVVGFGAEEALSLSGRLRLGDRWRNRHLTRRAWSSLFRRIGVATRPLSCWLVVRSDVEKLSHSSPPEVIVYCDETATTSAWHAGRLWQSVPIVVEHIEP